MSLEVGEIRSLKDRFLIRDVLSGLRRLMDDRPAKLAMGYLSFMLVIAIVGPYIAPYPYDEILFNDAGQILRAQPPSLMHPLGTTSTGQDVLSRIIYGVRPTMITGLLGGLIIVSLGGLVGITAGYLGGQTDNALMRITDFIYGIPLIPFAIVLVGVFGIDFFVTIFIIGAVLWRGSARVLRSKVLQIKQRPYILMTKASGASTPYIIFKHIVPNVGSMVILFFAMGIGYAIIAQAGLAFVGVSDPFIPSWGIMIRNAYRSGLVADAWWWSLPPGVLISTTVLSAIMLGRRFEVLSGQTDDAMLEMG
ncbi:ABC transporter permease subunit [Haloferax sp. MBLA0077]|uniref:ABC transporter permease subunit n=3 Tax=Haloferacaceae TaxID=1644056 RepID=A0A6G1Z610_9EURY|nr:ABC transporter permease [Haloferax sp. CBA1149]MRW81999.1 ABC transporter permease subunit [Haloferax marinisediminis]